MNAPDRGCRLCTAPLRAEQTDPVCAPCARAVGFQRPIPQGFYDGADLRRALAGYDFGPVFRAVRQQTGLSQLQLAGLLDLSQSRVSAVERGERRLAHVTVVARLATALGIPARLLGFPADSVGNVAAEEVSWVDRRDFLTLVTAAAVGSGLHPELARLGALLPGGVEPVTRPRIGAADVDAIEAVTDGFRRSEQAHGGGLGRAAAGAQLQQVRSLDNATCSPEIRARLLVATADLALTAGWMAYDMDQHDSARRLWTFTLDTARRAEGHPRSTDLAVTALLDLAYQGLHLDRPREALQLVQLGSATAANRFHPVGTLTQGCISTHLGWCRAALGEVEPCRRAMGEAREAYAGADPATTPQWLRYVTDAEISAQQGYALYLLSLSRPAFALAAVERLAGATDEFGATYAKSRAVMLPPLAVAQFRAGDLDAAVATGYQAVSALSGLSLTRGYARLRVMDTVAEPFSGKPEVAELREHVRTALAMAA